MINIPRIKISAFLDSNSSLEDRLSVSKSIYSAMTDFGCFYLEFPIQTPILNESAQFFKNNLKHSIQFKNGRGYLGIGEESGSLAFESKEAFSYGHESGNGTNKLNSPNVWPESNTCTLFKSSCTQFYNEMVSCSEALIQAISLSLSKPIDFLSEYCKNGSEISLMRLIHYIPSEHSIGSSEHTDWGFLTLILQSNNTSSLEIFYDNQWIDVPPIQRTIFVNGGDYLSLLTNGVFKSPLHRVLTPKIDRYSAVFFYYPDYDSVIPSINVQGLSMFKDQRSSGKHVIIESKCFGDFISEKWDQVYRN